MPNKEIKTPKYWEKERYQPLVEVETVHGNKVMIPKKFIDGWQTAKLTKQEADRLGLDPLGGSNAQILNPLYQDLERVYHEIYEEG
jgi:hypothetical protein